MSCREGLRGPFLTATGITSVRIATAPAQSTQDAEETTMALKIEANGSAVAHHITGGAHLFPYAVDATHAISNHPLEWKDSPWSQADAAAARSKLDLPAATPLSPEDQAALDEHNKAVEAAAKRLADYNERKAKEKA